MIEDSLRSSRTVDLNSKGYALDLFFKKTYLTEEEMNLLAHTHNNELLKMIQEQNYNIAMSSALNYEQLHSNFTDLGKAILTIEENINTLISIKNKENLRKSKSQENPDRYNENNEPELDIQLQKCKDEIVLKDEKLNSYRVKLESMEEELKNETFYLGLIEKEKQKIFQEVSNEYFTLNFDFKDQYCYDIAKLFLEIYLKLNESKNSNFFTEIKNSINDPEKRNLLIKSKFDDYFKVPNFHKELVLLNFKDFSTTEINRMKGIVENILVNIEEDDILENEFFKLLKFFKILIYSEIGFRRISNLELELKNLKEEFELLTQDNDKIKLEVLSLQENKTKIYNNRIRKDYELKKIDNIEFMEKEFKINNINQVHLKAIIKDLKNLKNKMQISYTTYLKQIGNSLTKFD